MMSDIPIDDPCDKIDFNTLDGWIKYDSSEMCKTDNGERLGGNRSDRYQNSRVRFDRS